MNTYLKNKRNKSKNNMKKRNFSILNPFFVSKCSKYLYLVCYMCICSCQEQTIQNISISKLPSLYVSISPEELDSILNNREYKASSQALLVDFEGDTVYEGVLEYIKTRGNSTFGQIKKPFTIKFPNKQRLFGLYKSQSFTLLANVFDESHIRNAIAFDLARSIGLPAPRYAYLSLYFNDEYMGLYQITNKVEINKHMLHITDLDKLNKQVNPFHPSEYSRFRFGEDERIVQCKGVLLEHDPDDISGGYLLDNSGMNWIYDRSISGFVSDAGDPIRIREPQYASVAEVSFISSFYNQMEASILASDGINPQTKKHYSEYIDVESFAHYYLLNELLLNEDGGFVSFFMYKDSDSIDSRLHAGPIWDFDCSLDSPMQEIEFLTHNEFYVSAPINEFGEPHSGGLLYHLNQHSDFKQIVKSCYCQEISPIIHDFLSSGCLDRLTTVLYDEAERDNQLYKTRRSSDYYAATNRAIGFLNKRLEFLDWFFSSSEDNMICVHYPKGNGGPHQKEVYCYFPTETPIYIPKFRKQKMQYNHDPILTLYNANTNDIVQEGTVFHSAQRLELRWREPTRREIFVRRIKKKFGIRCVN